MGKLKDILALSDPYPNIWYEASCYLKAASGTLFLIFGTFFLFYSFFLEVNLGPFVTSVTPPGKQIFTFVKQFFGDLPGWNIFLGAIFTALGIYSFYSIKLVRDLWRLLKR